MKKVAMKALPKILQPYYSISTIQNADIPLDDKMALVKQYGKGAKDWSVPRTERARTFALEMILYTLTNVGHLKIGTLI